jgi:hypothetical protein
MIVRKYEREKSAHVEFDSDFVFNIVFIRYRLLYAFIVTSLAPHAAYMNPVAIIMEVLIVLLKRLLTQSQRFF